MTTGDDKEPRDPEKVRMGNLIRAKLGDHTQTWLERKTGIAQPHLSAIMNGRRGVKPHQLRRIAQALGVTVDSLVPTPETESSSRPHSDVSAARERPVPAPLQELFAEEGEFISPWERERLISSTFGADRWVEFDKAFYRHLLDFWRQELQRRRTDHRGTNSSGP